MLFKIRRNLALGLMAALLITAFNVETFANGIPQNEIDTSSGDTPKTSFKFAAYEHDFGIIEQDSEHRYAFAFTNTGAEPLIIESALGSCACLVPTYPKVPIAPGGTGVIEVFYRPGKQENQQVKTVTVRANTSPLEITLRVKAIVQKVGASNGSTMPITPVQTFDPSASAYTSLDGLAKTSIKFAAHEHDFGTIEQDSEHHYAFAFTNTGAEPLIIESAHGSCACVVPNYPKVPIAPGGTGVVEVVYRPGKQENQQVKTVTVRANTSPLEITLRVKAIVQKVK